MANPGTARSGHATYYISVALLSQNQAANTSTLNVHIYADSDSGSWSGFASNIGFSANGYGNGTFSFNGTHIEIVNYNMVVGHDANGYCNFTIAAHTNATGTQSFGGPLDWSATGSLPRIPKAPGAPGISVGAFTGRSVPITVTYLGNDGGSSITNIVTQYSKDGGAWTGLVNGGWGTRTYANLAPGSYVFAAYSQNTVGSGPSALTGAVKVSSGGKVRVAGAWKDGLTRVRVGGAWRDGIVKVRSGGAWKDGR